MSIKFRLAHQNFELDCPPADKAAMCASIERVEGKLREVRQDFNVSDNQRGVIIAAILIAFESQQGSDAGEGDGIDAAGAVKSLEGKIDAALARTAPS